MFPDTQCGQPQRFGELNAANEPLDPGSNQTAPKSAPPLLSQITASTWRKAFPRNNLSQQLLELLTLSHSKLLACYVEELTFNQGNVKGRQ